MLNLRLSKKELTLIDQVLSVPLYAFGLEQLLKKTGLGKEQIEAIHSLFRNVLETSSDTDDTEVSISDADLKDFVNIYNISCEIIDPTEMHTLTGYEWEESQDLSMKLSQALI